MKPDTTDFTALEPASSTSVASGHPCRSSLPSTRGRHAYRISIVAVPVLDETSLDETQRRQCRAGISSPCPRDFEPACRSAVPCRWHRAIEWRRRRCNATGSTSVPGPADGMTMPAASMMLIRPLWFPYVGQNSKKIMGAEGRSRTGVKTSLVASGAGFSVMMVPSAASS